MLSKFHASHFFIKKINNKNDKIFISTLETYLMQ